MRRTDRLLLFALFLLFALLRLYRLGANDLWFDEFCTFGYAKNPFDANESCLYYALIKLVRNFSGLSEFWLRLPSACFSIASVCLTYILGKRFFGRGAGIMAAVIMGLSPFHLWYAQEARSYSMALFMGLASSFYLLEAMRKSTTLSWSAYTVITVAGIYVNYFNLLLLFPHFLYALIVKRPKKTAAVVSIIAAIFALLLPLIYKFLWRFYQVEGGFWINVPDAQSLRFTFENFILGYSGTQGLYAAGNILTLILAGAAATCFFDKEKRGALLFCVLSFALPLGLAYIFSINAFSIYLDRGFIILTPYFYLTLSCAVTIRKRKYLLPVFALMTGILTAGDLRYFNNQMTDSFKHHNGAYLKKPLERLARFAQERQEEGKDLWAFTNLSPTPILAYCKKPLAYYFLFAPGMINENKKKPFEETAFTIPCVRITEMEFEKLWVVASDWGRTGRLDANSQAVKKWLNQNLELFFEQDFDGVLVSGYRRSVSAENGIYKTLNQ